MTSFKNILAIALALVCGWVAFKLFFWLWGMMFTIAWYFMMIAIMSIAGVPLYFLIRKMLR